MPNEDRDPVVHNPIRGDELPREVHIYIAARGRLQMQHLSTDGNGKVNAYVNTDSPVAGFSREYTAPDGERWRVSVEPIAANRTDERPFGEQAAELEREALGRIDRSNIIDNPTLDTWEDHERDRSKYSY